MSKTPLDGNHLEQVKHGARAKAKSTKRVYYVIYEPDHTGVYHACDDFDLDTFYGGISDQNILYCTADDQGGAL
jgi:hypothetical protein